MGAADWTLLLVLVLVLGHYRSSFAIAASHPRTVPRHSASILLPPPPFSWGHQSRDCKPNSESSRERHCLSLSSGERAGVRASLSSSFLTLHFLLPLPGRAIPSSRLANSLIHKLSSWDGSGSPWDGSWDGFNVKNRPCLPSLGRWDDSNPPVVPPIIIILIVLLIMIHIPASGCPSSSVLLVLVLVLGHCHSTPSTYSIQGQPNPIEQIFPLGPVVRDRAGQNVLALALFLGRFVCVRNYGSKTSQPR